MIDHTVLAATLALAVGLTIGWYSTRRWMLGQTKEAIEVGLAHARQRALSDIYQAVILTAPHSVRYEIRIDDWGPGWESEQMRYRWSIWDADRALRVQAAQGLVDPVGVELPYMLGNAAEAADAWVAAISWVRDQNEGDPESAVLS